MTDLSGPLLARRRRSPLAACLLATVAWSFGPIFVHAIQGSIASITFMRLWIAQPIMIGGAYMTGGRLSWRIVRSSAVPGVLLGISMALSYLSYVDTSIVDATLIAALQPVVMLFLAPLVFGERTTLNQRVMAAVSLIGLTLVVFGSASGSSVHFSGNLFALGNLIAWTGYFIAVKRLRASEIHSGSLTAGMFLVAAIAVTPWAIMSGEHFGQLGGEGYLWIILIVLVPGALGHGLMTWAHAHVRITVSSLLTLLEPPLAAILAWLIFKQTMDAVQLAGAVIVIVSLALLVAKSRSAADMAFTD